MANKKKNLYTRFVKKGTDWQANQRINTKRSIHNINTAVNVYTNDIIKIIERNKQKRKEINKNDNIKNVK